MMSINPRIVNAARINKSAVALAVTILVGFIASPLSTRSQQQQQIMEESDLPQVPGFDEPSAQNAHAFGAKFRARLQQRINQKAQSEPSVPDITDSDTGGYTTSTLAGLKVAIWKPSNSDIKAPFPVVIFSHGYRGGNTQTKFLMQAMADAGYLVFAPNHQDAMSNGGLSSTPEVSFSKPSQWRDTTFKDRHDDIVGLIAALHRDPQWNSQIDWSRLALAGHSLGGYTSLGLAGAWPSWKIKGVKAVLALSPYCAPFVATGKLDGMQVPVMYQGGTRDFGITPSVKIPGGAFMKTSSPAYFVEFDQMGHLGWTNLNRNQEQQKLIDYYSLAFLDKYVKGSTQAKLLDKTLPGVVDLKSK